MRYCRSIVASTILHFTSTVTFPRQKYNCAKRHTRRQLTTPQRLPHQTHICRFADGEEERVFICSRI